MGLASDVIHFGSRPEPSNEKMGRPTGPPATDRQKGGGGPVPRRRLICRRSRCPGSPSNSCRGPSSRSKGPSPFPPPAFRPHPGRSAGGCRPRSPGYRSPRPRPARFSRKSQCSGRRRTNRPSISGRPCPADGRDDGEVAALRPAAPGANWPAGNPGASPAGIVSLRAADLEQSRSASADLPAPWL